MRNHYIVNYHYYIIIIIIILIINVHIDRIVHEDLLLQIYLNHDARHRPSMSHLYFESILHVIHNQAYRHSKAIIRDNLRDRKRLDGCYQDSKQLMQHRMYVLRVFSYALLLEFPNCIRKQKIFNYIFQKQNYVGKQRGGERERERERESL